jgi:integrase
MVAKPIGRPKKYAEYEELVKGLPKVMRNRPKYVNGIGVFRGARGETVFIKIRLPKGAVHNGKSYKPGSSLELKLGNRSSFSWKQLEQIKDDMQGRADRGEPLEDNAPMLFSEWSAEWLKRANDRLKGFATPKGHVDGQFNPKFGNKGLSDISTSDINKWIARRMSEVSSSTVHREMGTLSSVFSGAVKEGHLDTNPCVLADKVKKGAGRQRFLDGDEITRILKTAENVADWLSDFLLWSLHSGMRKSETLAMQWSNVSTIGDNRKLILIPTSKSDQPRMVPCNAKMAEILERQHDRKVDQDKRVFPISKMTLRRKWEKTRKDASLEDVTLHDFRRTHSTHAAAAGVDLRTLAARMGHSNLTMLEKHYAVVVGSAAMNAADTIQATFDNMIGPKKD